MKTNTPVALVKHIGLASLLAGCMAACGETVEPPAPYGAIPSEKQINWQQMQYYMFVHFGPNTFTDVEWGDGKEDPKVFNPSALDCRQWAATAKAAGMKGIIITAKHHDGFCLWPSAYSTHTVRESGWKDGKGDVLKELSEACREYGLKFGVYLSPWDQNHVSYGTPEYNQVFANTLTEVLTGYGEVFEQWFDGANGDAHHKGKKQVYDWDLFHQTVYNNQPQAMIFSDVGPDCRWMGNEKGIAGETNWSTLDIEGFEPGLGAPPTNILSSGNVDGEAWVPAETDVSIRPGWFYSPRTDNQVKSIDHLVDIYYTSIGRNSNLLLNVPPNREGRIHPTDSTRLMEFRKAIEESFAVNMIEGAELKAMNTRGGSSRFAVANLLNDNYNSYWAADDDVSETSIEIDLKEPKTFNRFLVQEYIPLGQRISAFAIEKWNESAGAWEAIAEGTTIGNKRILRFPQVTAQKLRLHLKETLASPVLNQLGIYMAPESFGQDNNSVSSPISVSPSNWKIITPTGPGREVIDEDLKTAVTITGMQPLTVDMGKTISLKGFVYIPEDNVNATNITRYNFSVSTDGKNWDKLVADGIFTNIKNNPIAQAPLFTNSVKARYFRLEPLETTTMSKDYQIVEINVIKE